MASLPYISAIIPALNEEETISNVIKNLLQAGVSRVNVVDNGSTDLTQARAQEAGAHVIPEPQRGYGKACLTGISHLPEETKWVLFCDADGSDDLAELPRLFSHLEQADFLVGNRRATAEGRENLTPVQNFGNWLSGFLMKLGWGRGFSDLGPLRLIKKETLDELKMEDENFGWTVEMQAKALTHEINYQEIPVNYLPRQGGVSKISGNFKASAKAGQIILTTLGKLWLEKPRTQGLFTLLACLFLLLGTYLMGFHGDPASAKSACPFMLGAILMGGGFICAYAVRQWSPLLLLPLALLLRLLLLHMPPGDDVWRYLWEGYIQNAGFNPYNTPPEAETLAHLRTEWWHKINHKDVTAIYPPLTQLIFKSLASLSGTVLSLKLLFLLADFSIGCLLFKRFGSLSAWYLLNPLVLYSFSGGAHYEPLFLLPLVGAWLLWEKNESSFKGVFLIGLLLGISFSLKIVGILATGFIGFSLLMKCLKAPVKNAARLLLFLMGFLLVPLLSYLLFCAASGTPDSLFPETFTSKARSGDLVPWLMEFSNETDEPFPNKTFLPLLCVTFFFITLSTRSLSTFITRSFLALLAFSPMVHAWYFTWLIPFALRKHARVCLALSLSAFLYFLMPYRVASGGEWMLYHWERLLLWSPLLFLIPSIYRYLKSDLILPAVRPWK